MQRLSFEQVDRILGAASAFCAIAFAVLAALLPQVYLAGSNPAPLLLAAGVAGLAAIATGWLYVRRENGGPIPD